MSVKDVHVVIPGAAAGAGGVVAEWFAKEDAKVVASDISDLAVAKFAAERSDIRVLRSNAAEERDIDTLFERALSYPGGIDLLINNAGIAGLTLSAEDISIEQWIRRWP